jgi:hypothetical protein
MSREVPPGRTPGGGWALTDAEVAEVLAASDPNPRTELANLIWSWRDRARQARKAASPPDTVPGAIEHLQARTLEGCALELEQVLTGEHP